MPRSGGVYTLPSGNPVVTLTVISSSWANTTMSDIATALTGSLPTDGSAPLTGQLRLQDGTVGNPALTWATDTSSGWYKIGTHSFGFSVGTTLSLSVSANLGWTIAAPTSGTALTVNGVAGSYAITTVSPTTAGQSYGLIVKAGTNSSDFALVVTNAAAATMLSLNGAGNLTIAAPASGTAFSAIGVAGAYALQVVGSATASQSYGIIIKAGTSNSDFALAVQNAASATMLSVSGSGNVIIAAPASGSALVVQTGNAGVGVLIAGTTKGVRIFNSAAGTNIEGVDNTGSGSYQALTIGASGLTFQIASVTAMTVSATGNFVLSTPTSGTALTVNAAATTVGISVLTFGAAAGLDVQGGTAAPGFVQMGGNAVIGSCYVGAAGGASSLVTGASTNNLILRCSTAIIFSVDGGTTIAMAITGNPTTGAQTPSLGTNKPGAAAGAPAKWIPVTAGGSSGWIPLWL